MTLKVIFSHLAPDQASETGSSQLLWRHDWSGTTDLFLFFEKQEQDVSNNYLGNPPSMSSISGRLNIAQTKLKGRERGKNRKIHFPEIPFGLSDYACY